MYMTLGIVVSPALGIIVTAFLLYFHGFIRNVKLFFILLASVILVIVPVSFYSMLYEHDVTSFIKNKMPFLGEYAWLVTVILPALVLFVFYFAALQICKRKLVKGDVFTIIDIFAVAGLASC